MLTNFEAPTTEAASPLTGKLNCMGPDISTLAAEERGNRAPRQKHRAYTRRHIYRVTNAVSKTPANHQTTATAAMSDVVAKTFNITEMATLIFEKVPTRDLVRATRVCKTFNKVIMDNRTSADDPLKLFCTPSTKPVLDYIFWKENRALTRNWQPYMGTALDAQSNNRARPIFDLNPALAQYEDRTGQEPSLAHGWINAIITVNPEVFASALPAGSPWLDMLLTQPGSTDASVTFFCDRDQWVRDHQGPDDLPMALQPGGLMMLTSVPVIGTGPHAVVLLRDVKQALSDARSSDFGPMIIWKKVEIKIKGGGEKVEFVHNSQEGAPAQAYV